MPAPPPVGPLEDDPHRWRQWLFDSLADECATAMRVSGMVDRDFRIGGRGIRLRFAGETFANLMTRAFAHLAAPALSQPEVTISLWEPPPGVKPVSFLLRAYLAAVTHDWWDFVNQRGELIDFHGPPFLAAYHPGSQLLSLLDLEQNLGLCRRSSELPLPYYEAGSPLRTMLHWWFRGQGMQFLHAAAVGNGAGGVLLAGRGGSGKSTAALACGNSGLQYLGDDYCMVGLHPARVYSLYNTCKLVGDGDIARFPGLASRIWNQHREGDEKATVFLQEHWPEWLTGETPLKAILLPHISGESGSSVRPCAGMEALTALAPTTIAQLPSSGIQELRFMKELVQRVPCFVLNVGTDLSTIPVAIERLLAEKFA